jgi:hypothetical protein
VRQGTKNAAEKISFPVGNAILSRRERDGFPPRKSLFSAGNTQDTGAVGCSAFHLATSSIVNLPMLSRFAISSLEAAGHSDGS